MNNNLPPSDHDPSVEAREGVSLRHTPQHNQRVGELLGHVMTVPAIPVNAPGHNQRIEVLSPEREGERAQIYQTWVVELFSKYPIIAEALEVFGLAGNADKKEEWVQLLEHIGGVAAIMLHIEKLLVDHGADPLEISDIESAALIHDIAKRTEVVAALELAQARELEDSAGLENDFANKALQDNTAAAYLKQHGVSERIIEATHNTRDNTYFSDDSHYDHEDDLEIAHKNRQRLAEQTGLTLAEINAMSPDDRRRTSLDASEDLLVLTRLSDAVTKQYIYQGVSDNDIDSTADHYRTTKRDRQSQVFFGKDGDWVNFYKAARHSLIDRVPEENRADFEAKLYALTHEDIFNGTVLPAVIGTNNPQAMERLRYPEGKFTEADTWTHAKAANPEKNEDQSYIGEVVLVLADGETDKTGVTYPSGKSGGHELAKIATRVASMSLKTGYELADEVTSAVRAFYTEHNPDALKDPSKRAATTLVTARLVGDKLIITQIGDTNIRVTKADGSQEILTNDKLVDTENAAMRSRHIHSRLSELSLTPTAGELDEIIASGRGVIQERLNKQYVLQNNATDSRYGYGTIDGQLIPREFTDGTPTDFVRIFTYPSDGVVKVELISDGFYGEFPESANAEDYQALYARLHQEDPYKYRTYLSTKSLDDATVVIADIQG